MSHDAALAHLVKRSQDSNTKLRTLAQRIVMSTDDAATVVSIA